MNNGFLGTFPQWLLVIIVATLGVYVRWYLGHGKLKVDHRQIDTNAEGRLRDHYSEELKSLRSQVISMGQHHLEREREIDDRWRTLLRESEERHDECVKQREMLANRLSEVEQRQIAQVRQFISYQRSIISVLPDSLKTPQMIAALEALELGEPDNERG